MKKLSELSPNTLLLVDNMQDDVRMIKKSDLPKYLLIQSNGTKEKWVLVFTAKRNRPRFVLQNSLRMFLTGLTKAQINEVNCKIKQRGIDIENIENQINEVLFDYGGYEPEEAVNIRK